VQAQKRNYDKIFDCLYKKEDGEIMKKLFGFTIMVLLIAFLVACGNEDRHLAETEIIVVDEYTTESNNEEAGEDDIGNGNVNTALFEGLYFELFEIFEVETIAEITQYHLSEDMRNDPSVTYMLEYHMGTPVLFIPINITTIEISGDSDYRFRPEIRRWTPSGRRSLFEADTLNGREIFQLVTFDEIPNREGAIVHGYLPFIWEGYGEYRIEIIWSNEVGAEFIFNIDSSNVF